jgi:hypothetical protein
MRFKYILLVFVTIVSYVLSAQTQPEMHKVKRHETVYGIAHQYGITEQELINANPEMDQSDYKLKKGTFLFIPKHIETPVVIKNDIKGRAIKVGVLLPIHNVNGDGRRMADYYRGLLMACDSLKSEGISVDVSTWNVTDNDDIRIFLLNESLKSCDVIFGPLYSTQVHDLSNFVKDNNIKLFIPFSISSSDVYTNSNIFQVYQSENNMNFETVGNFMTRFVASHPVFIDCNDTSSTKGTFTSELRRQLETKKIGYNITNVNSPEDLFSKAFNRNKPNVVILNSASLSSLKAVIIKLKSFSTNYPGVVFSVFGYQDWLSYANQLKDDFYKMDTYVPTTFYCDHHVPRSAYFIKNYRRWFNTDMLNTSQRFAMTGFDHAYYFLKGLNMYGKGFTGARGNVGYTPMQTPLRFERAGGGGFINHSMMFVHYSYNHNIEIINY